MSNITKAFLPVGTRTKNEITLIRKGDVLTLANGDSAIFVSMRRTKFEAIIKGKTLIVPMWRDTNKKTPFVVNINGRDESVIAPKIDISSFTKGQLFGMEGQKETFMFIGFTPTGKVQGLDLVTKKTFNIATNFTFIKIDIDEVKRKSLR